MNPLRRYRAYLLTKVAGTAPPRTMEMGWYSVPWMLPLLLLLGAQSYLRLEGPFWYYLTMAAFGLLFFGISLVGWVFGVDGFKEDLSRYKAAKKQRLKD